MTKNAGSMNVNTNNNDVEILIYAPQEGAPEHKRADVVLRVKDGLLRGNRLKGFAVWQGKRKKDGAKVLAVTPPSQEGIDKSTGEVKYYPFVLGDLTYLTERILEAYAVWAASGDGELAVHHVA